VTAQPEAPLAGTAIEPRRRLNVRFLGIYCCD
jgi:hypothetical protein